jgi:hypothetical protein
MRAAEHGLCVTCVEGVTYVEDVLLLLRLAADGGAAGAAAAVGAGMHDEMHVHTALTIVPGVVH